MPTYQYKCSNCGYEFEAFRKISQRKIPEGRCVECNDGDVRQIPTSTSVMYTMRDGFRRHTSDGFKDRMKEIHRTTPGSQLGDYA